MSMISLMEGLGFLSMIIIVAVLVSAVVAEYGHKTPEEEDWNNHI